MELAVIVLNMHRNIDCGKCLGYQTPFERIKKQTQLTHDNQSRSDPLLLEDRESFEL